jgi:heme exporter protein D
MVVAVAVADKTTPVFVLAAQEHLAKGTQAVLVALATATRVVAAVVRVVSAVMVKAVLVAQVGRVYQVQ